MEETSERTGLRVLGRLRISLSRDESTSIDRQRREIQQWANAQGHEVIGWATDDGVSGSVSPWDTPGLGPWLNERSDQFDILCSWKLDRLARRSTELHKLFAWIEEHNKRLVCTAEQIDLGNWVGRVLAGVIAGLAEGELEAIRERQQASQTALRATPLRFRGGKPPYGYTTAPLDGGGRTLVQHPEHADIVHRIVDQIIEGVPAGHVADRLNQDCIQAPSGEVGAWGGNTIRHLVRSPHLVGHKVHKGQLVVDGKGRPVPITAEPLEAPKRQADALAEISRASTTKQTHKASPLSKLALCGACKRYLHMTTAPSRREKKAYRYYRCVNCKGAINADTLERLIYTEFLDTVGEAVEMEAIVTRPKDHTEELQHIDNALRNLTNIAKTVSGPVADQVIQEIADHSARRDRLQAEHDQGNKIEWKPTGRGLWRDQFQNADPDGKRRILERAGMSIVVRLDMNVAGVVTPPDLAEKLSAGTSRLSPLHDFNQGDDSTMTEEWWRSRDYLAPPMWVDRDMETLTLPGGIEVDLNDSSFSTPETSQKNTGGNNTTGQTPSNDP